MVIRGLKSDSAVLCTSNKTFEIKDTETSNSILIMQHCVLGIDTKPQGDEFMVEHVEVCLIMLQLK